MSNYLRIAHVCVYGLYFASIAGCTDSADEGNTGGTAGSATTTTTGTDMTGTGTDSGSEAGECAEGLTLCEGACIDTESDPSNCGGCGNGCGAMFECYDYGCHHRCDDGGGDYCGGSCIYTEWDDAHCGACDNACAPEDSCMDSECVPDSGTGETTGG